jgi:hypothetical protein
MSKEARRELLKAVRPRYLKAGKKEKGRILDEFVAVTGYARKYAIHILKNGPQKRPKKNRKAGRQPTYGRDVVAALEKVWQASGRICGKRLKPFMEEMVAALERHGELVISSQVRDKLLQISAAQIDRVLKPARAREPLRGRTTTKPGSLLKAAIPVRTFADWNEKQPGFLEVDLVAHCGQSTAGEYLHTLSAVDIDTRWFELVALPNRGQKATLEAIRTMHQRLPFPLLGLDSDNGSEFINAHLYRYCTNERITFTRSRPYKKNDQAHVEQKNWTAVRQWVGYDRFQGPEQLALLNTIYTDLRLFINFFQPVMKLVHKSRVGSRVYKKYDLAKTPYQRVMDSPDVDVLTKQQLKEMFLTLNPVALQRRIHTNLEKLWS